jgi:hypothetical protein
VPVTALTAPTEVGALARPGGATLALTRLEGRRLVTHPAFALGLLLTFTYAFGSDVEFFRHRLLLGGVLGGTAVGVMVAANLIASRARRHGTEELYDSLPVTGATRTVAHLLAVGWGVGAGVVVVAVTFVAARGWDGLAVPAASELYVGEQVRPALAELAQGPLFVAFAGVLGVAMASWIPSTVVAVVVAVVGLSQVQVPMVLWWGMGTGSWWLLPLVHDLDVVGGNGDQLVVEQVRVAAMGWHLVYLAGLVVVVAAAALARRRRDGGVAGMVAVGSLLVVAGGAAQLAAP